MKTATIPPVRIEPKFRDEIVQALEQGETMAALVEKAVRGEVARRRDQAEFVRRGMAAIARSDVAGDGVPAEAVLAKLDARLAAAKKTRRA
jgi:predicted transcriptional regulator